MRPEKYSRGDALRVLWMDSTHTGGWTYEEEPPVGVEEVVSLGYFINDSVDGINLSTTLSDRGGVLSLVAIPWNAIREIQQILGWGRYEVTPET